MKRLNQLLSSWYTRWVVIAIVIKLIISAITLHPDLWAFSFSGKIFVDQGILDIYNYLHNLPLNSPYFVYGSDFFTYPPLAYFVLGIFRFLLQPFFNQNFYLLLFANFDKAYLVPGIFQHALLVKLPYLVFDIPAAFLMANLFQDEKKKRLAFLLWVFNPLSIYSSFMIGQFDIIPTFFIILSLFFALKKRNYPALLSLGVGGAFKIFPLLLVPIAVFALSNKSNERIKLLLLGFLPFVVTILPFIKSETFRTIVVFSGQSQKLLYSGINVSGADTLYLFVIFYVLTLIYNAFTKNNDQFHSVWKYLFIVLLFLYAVTNFHPQWFVWISPFLILFTINFPNFRPLVFGLLLLALAIILTFDSSLSYGLFSPLLPALNNTKSLLDISADYIPPSVIRSIVRSIFAAFSISLIIITFNQLRLKLIKE